LPKVALFIFCKNTHQMHVSAQDRTGDLARKVMWWPLQYRNKRMLETLCRLSQYQTFEIDRKFIQLVVPYKSIWIILVKQPKEHWRATWVTIVELVPVGYIFLV
jgi:hypothetical protein